MLLQGLSGKLSELEEELEKASKELENEKAENTARVDEIESLKQVRFSCSFLLEWHLQFVIIACNNYFNFPRLSGALAVERRLVWSGERAGSSAQLCQGNSPGRAAGQAAGAVHSTLTRFTQHCRGRRLIWAFCR